MYLILGLNQAICLWIKSRKIHSKSILINFSECTDNISGHNTDTLRICATTNFAYSSVANSIDSINGQSDCIEALEEINIIGDEEIIVGEVVHNASSEGVKCINTLEEIHVQRDEDYTTVSALQVVPVEDALKIECVSNDQDKDDEK